MNDIQPPRRPNRPVAPRPATSSGARPPRTAPVPIDHRIAPPKPELLLEATEPSAGPTPPPTAPVSSKKGWSWRRWLALVLGALLLLSLIGGVVAYMWYQSALASVSTDKNADRVKITIKSGTTPSQIRDILLDKNLIRSKTAFDIYTRLSGTQNKLQAGAYRLSPAESTPDIVNHLVAGNVDEITVTFYPGATLTDTTDKAENKKVDVTTILKRAGYTEAEITAALNKTYNHPVFATKPASADLEGYVYGETYNFSSSASVEDILTRTFDELYKTIQDNKLEAGFKAQGLSLHEGIILSSIVQREVGVSEDQKQVAGVFYNRLKDGMKLGSDVTYHYAADKLGVARDFTLDSPYNTRLYTGLPPGPIAAPGASALLATAYPASNDYLYFLSGDDNKTYFGRTNAEHEANIRDHCSYKCSLP